MAEAQMRPVGPVAAPSGRRDRPAVGSFAAGAAISFGPTGVSALRLHQSRRRRGSFHAQPAAPPVDLPRFGCLDGVFELV
jgi:hypothetical protein